jgi:hypothetical protein
MDVVQLACPFPSVCLHRHLQADICAKYCTSLHQASTRVWTNETWFLGRRGPQTHPAMVCDLAKGHRLLSISTVICGVKWSWVGVGDEGGGW